MQAPLCRRKLWATRGSNAPPGCPGGPTRLLTLLLCSQPRSGVYILVIINRRNSKFQREHVPVQQTSTTSNTDLRHAVEEVGGVYEGGRLLCDRLQPPGVGVACQQANSCLSPTTKAGLRHSSVSICGGGQLRTQCIHCNPRCKVQVLPAMRIVEPRALSMREDHVWPHICLHDIPVGCQTALTAHKRCARQQLLAMQKGCRYTAAMQGAYSQ